MNYFDITILLVLLFFTIRGLFKGLVIELSSVLALIIGIWGAIRFSGFVGNRLTEVFGLSTQWLGLIAFALTFVLIIVLVHFAAIAIDKLFSAIALGWLVKILGAFFGLAKGLIIVSIVLVILNTINERVAFLPPEKVNESLFYRPVAKIVPAIFPLVVNGDLIKSFDKLKKKSEDSSI